MTTTISLTMTPRQAERLRWAVKRGELADVGVVDVEVRVNDATASGPSGAQREPTAPARVVRESERSSLVQDLIAAGIHFGQRRSVWNPKMEPYVYGERNKLLIIDIRETVKGILLAKRFLQKTVVEGKDVCFVGTKRQARAAIEKHASSIGMPFVVERWLGGTLTNFRTIRERLKRLEELERLVESGEIETYSKKMTSQLLREKRKITRNLRGIRGMDRLPGALAVVDVNREANALREARSLGIPTVCLIDTDGDPDLADIPIPGNDDSMRSIDVVIRELCRGISAGLAVRERDQKTTEAQEEPDKPSRRRSSRAAYRAEEHPPIAEPAPGIAEAAPEVASDEPGGSTAASHRGRGVY